MILRLQASGADIRHSDKLGTDALLHIQGTKPEVRTYNTIINACNRSGQPEHALKVYERMIADGTQPTATTYTALISAYGKTGKVASFLRTIYTGFALKENDCNQPARPCEGSPGWQTSPTESDHYQPASKMVLVSIGRSWESSCTQLLRRLGNAGLVLEGSNSKSI